MSCEMHPSSRVCVLLLTVAPTFPVFHHVDSKYTRIPTVTIIVTIHPALVQQSIPSIHSPRSDPKDTAISFAAACFTNVIAARARDARVTYSVSIVSIGPEFGRPLTCLMFNSSHSGVKRFLSRCFVIRSAGLTLPWIFSILSSWFFSFCCSQKFFVSTCLIAPLHLGRASPRAAAASVQIHTPASRLSSRIELANPMASLAHRTML